jgi:hypothetical protein
MTRFLTEVDAWVTAAVLAAAMLAAWGAGWWKGRRLTRENRAGPPSKFTEASLALLGLLLAFTFSISLAKHDERRQMVVTDSNAIGDFYTCASLVKEPARARLQGVIREYAERRLALARQPLDDVTLEKSLADIQEMHNRMQTLVGEALDAGTPVAVPLVNTLNEVTSSHAARLAAWRDRLPLSIVALLFLTTLVAMALMGTQQGAAAEWHPWAMVGFVVLVSLVVGVTLDLNQPRRGLITVSQEPMRRVLSGMGQ